MKLFLIFVAILPLTLGARLNDRFLEALTGGYDSEFIAFVAYLNDILSHVYLAYVMILKLNSDLGNEGRMHK